LTSTGAGRIRGSCWTITRLSRWLCCRTERLNRPETASVFRTRFPGHAERGQLVRIQVRLPEEGSVGPFPAAILKAQRWVDRRVKSFCRGLREGPGCVRTWGNLGRASRAAKQSGQGATGTHIAPSSFVVGVFSIWHFACSFPQMDIEGRHKPGSFWNVGRQFQPYHGPISGVFRDRKTVDW
jgi:hypothetical protein